MTNIANDSNYFHQYSKKSSPSCNNYSYKSYSAIHENKEGYYREGYLTNSFRVLGIQRPSHGDVLFSQFGGFFGSSL